MRIKYKLFANLFIVLLPTVIFGHLLTILFCLRNIRVNPERFDNPVERRKRIEETKDKLKVGVS